MNEEQGRLEKQLRRAIQGSGLSAYRIAQESGVSEAVLSRFLNRQRTITLATASKLAEVLGLRLIVTTRRQTKKKVR